MIEYKVGPAPRVLPWKQSKLFLHGLQQSSYPQIKILARILFIGFPNSMESTKVPSTGFDFSAISTVGSSSSRPFLCFTSFLKFPLRLIQSTFESYKILREFKPQIVVGTGGHASFPVCFAAVISRTKFVIQEQDSIPGTTNWILSFFSDTIWQIFSLLMFYQAPLLFE